MQDITSLRLGYSEREIAPAIGVSVHFLRKDRRTKRCIPFYRLGDRVLYSLERVTLRSPLPPAILDEIESAKREPDVWEAQDIAAAIGFMATGLYRASIAYANRALTVPERRTPITGIEATDTPTGAQLCEALDYVASKPVRNI